MTLAQTLRALPASSGGLPLGATIAIGAAAAALFAIGAWFVWVGRHTEPDAPARTRLGRWKQSLSLPSRAAVGLSIMLLAYHGAVWISPWQDRLLSVPREFWWVVVGAVTLVIALSILTDHLEARP
jgi:hypothetical protein